MGKTEKQWAFIFHVLGEEELRKMLFRAARKKDDGGRVVVEFEDGKAMDVTEHYNELEDEVTR